MAEAEKELHERTQAEAVVDEIQTRLISWQDNLKTEDELETQTSADAEKEVHRNKQSAQSAILLVVGLVVLFVGAIASFLIYENQPARLCQVDYGFWSTYNNIAACLTACRAGNMDSCIKGSSALGRGQKGERDLEETEQSELHRRACDGGNLFACALLSSRYWVGIGIPKDKNRAFELAKKLCSDDNDVKNRNNCNHIKFMNKDNHEIIELYRIICNRGALNACFALIDIYLVGDGVPRDPNRAFAVAQGVCTSDDRHKLKCGEVAEKFECAKEYEKALELFKQIPYSSTEIERVNEELTDKNKLPEWPRCAFFAASHRRD